MKRALLGAGACFVAGVLDLIVLNLWLSPGVAGSAERRSEPAATAGPLAPAAAVASAPGMAMAPGGLSPAPVAPAAVSRTTAVPTPEPQLQAPDSVAEEPVGIVYFASDDASITGPSMAVLREVAEHANRRPALRVVVNGYTDRRGDRGHNRDLSSRRAGAVAGALIGLGVGANRIRQWGLGAAVPRDPEDGEVAFARNRRAEIRLTRGAQ